MNDAMLETMFSKFGKVFHPNQILFCEFEPGNDFYFFKEGKVKITKTVGSSIKTLDVLESGDILGEMAILEEQPRSATAIAITEVKALNFNRANFEMLMVNNPALAMKLLNIFSIRINDAKRRLSILLMEDIVGKIADVFLMLHEKSNPSDNNLHEVILQVTVEDVANWCAQPVGDVQKVLNQYVKSGKLDMYPNKIIIHNINDFQRIVNQKRKAT